MDGLDVDLDRRLGDDLLMPTVPEIEPGVSCDFRTIRARPFPERMRLICKSWALQLNPTPPVVYMAYVVKIVLLYVGGWCFFCSFTPGMGSPLSLGSWAFEAIAFQKAVLWSLTYEGLGLGCSTGPMTGRFVPPIGGCLHFLRPGTTKLPVFPGLAVIGGIRRTWLDVGLYAVIMGLLFRVLTAAEVTPAMLLPVLVLLPLLSLSDRTIFLCARGEHYYTAMVCLFYMAVANGAVWIAGCKVVWVAIWFWAATSKLNQHFPSVICVMLTNSPFVPDWLRRRLYLGYPDDLRPSRLAAAIAHVGTAVEYTFPLVLLASGGGPFTIPALVVMFSFHLFIAGNFPMGMPVEWNVMMVYGGFMLFGSFGEVSVLSLAATPWLTVFLLVMLVIIPLYGNLVPSRVSFLMAMRYYAGNWAYSVWLFRGDSARKLDALEKAVPLMRDQLAKIIDDEDMIEMALAMTPSFRLMHLHGRALHEIIPRAVDNIDDYEWTDGEIVAGLSVGWNFGDGHLHDLQLMRAIQEQCGFEPGELRIVFVESQPLGGSSLAWTIADAATGVLERGETRIADIADLQPWPTGPHAEAFLAGGQDVPAAPAGAGP
jgi:hypothetical protein